MAVRCPKCGNISANQLECDACGTKLASTARPTVRPASPPKTPPRPVPEIEEAPRRRGFATGFLLGIGVASIITMFVAGFVIFGLRIFGGEPPKVVSSTPLPLPTSTAAPAPVEAARPTSTPLITLPNTAKGIAELLQQAGPSVVRLKVGDGTGTGFVAFQRGQILTAYHVAEAATSGRVTVVSADGASHQATVLGGDGTRDLALLSAPTLQAEPLTFAKQVAVGDAVVAIGYAAGLSGDPSVTRGIVSAKRTEDSVALLQTDAPINPGNSGGPLMNERGEVVGVNVSRLTSRQQQIEGMGFAVSMEEVQRVSASLQSGQVKVSAVTPTRAVSPTPARKPSPTVTPRVIKEYTERREDGGVYLVQQWSDGHYTTPIFIRIDLLTSPIARGQTGFSQIATRPGASCQLKLPSESRPVGTAQAGPDGVAQIQWQVPNKPIYTPNAGSPSGYGISAECTHSGKMAAVTGTFQVSR